MKEKTSLTQKTLNIWAIILIIWAFYRANFKMPVFFDEFIAKPLVFVLPIFYYITKVEKKNFFAALLINTKLFFSDLIWAIFLGITFLSTAILTDFLKFNKFFLIKEFPSVDNIFFISTTALATAFSEESLSRGFVLRRLYDDSKNIYYSSFFSSILFFFLHVPILFTNQQVTGNLLLLFMTTDIILSLVNSFVFLTRKSLFLPIFIHALYNITLILFTS